MRLRVLGMICVVVALLSGFALFSTTQGSGRAWLDGVFLVAIAVALLIVLGALTRIAGRSLDAKIDRDRAQRAPEREMTGEDRRRSR